LKAPVLIPGVDFVINALLETSGLRCDGDCASALVLVKQRKITIRKAAGFTSRNRSVTISIGNAAKLTDGLHYQIWTARVAQRSGYSDCHAKSLFSFVEFTQQLLLQMSPRSLFDRTTLGDYLLLLRLAFALCSRFHRLR
jgi:hypothetical protein